MRVLINTSGNIGGGSKQVAISFINECIAFQDHLFYIVIGDSIKSEIFISDYPSNFHFIDIGKLKFYQLHKKLSLIEHQIVPDVVFTVFGPSYWKPKAPHLVGFALCYHINPNSPFFKMISTQEKFLLKLKKLIHLFCYMRESDAIVCETEDASNKIKLLMPVNKHYYTVSNTCNEYFIKYNSRGNNRQLLPHKNPDEFRLLLISKYYRHKNFEILPRVIDSLVQMGLNNIKFVLTINDNKVNDIFGSRYHDNIINIGPVPVWDCPVLYDECDAMFLPSLMECFSASYPEAMIMRKPILTSNYDFAKSICKDCAVYFNPLDIEDIVNCIIRVYSDSLLRENMISKGYEIFNTIPSTSSRAKSYIQILEDIYLFNNHS